jgi:hypothetical protein
MGTRQRLKEKNMLARMLVVLSVVLLGCSPSSSAPVPSDSGTVHAAKPHVLHGKRRQTGGIARPAAPDPRTPTQIALAACNSRCLGSAVKPVLAATTNVPIQPVSWTVPDWYIDTANSSGCALNSNSGTSATCTGGCSAGTCPSGIGPVLAAQEIITHRWGTPSPILPQTTTWHVLSTQPIGYEKIILSPALVANPAGVPSNFVILGTPAPFGAAFAAGVVTPKAYGSPGQLLTVATMPAAAVAGVLVQNVTTGSYATVDSKSGTTGTITQPITTASLTTVTAIPAPVEDNTWATGNTLQLAQLPTLNLEGLFPTGGDGNNAFSAPTFWVQFIDVPDASIPAGGAAGDSSIAAKPLGLGMTFAAVNFQTFPTIDGVNTVFGAFANGCWSPGGVLAVNAFMFGGAYNTALSFENVSDGAFLDGDVILHGTTETANGVNYTSVGAVYTDSRIALIHGGKVLMGNGVNPAGHPGGIIWGPGSIDEEGPGSGLQIGTVASGATFTNSLVVSSILLEAAATGDAYNNATGIWTAAVAITVGNLDAHGGLQNARTGSRYSQGE